MTTRLREYGPWEDPKEEPERAYCSSCEYTDERTVIPLGEQFLCLNCLVTFDTIDSRGWCSETVAGIDDVDSALCGCLFCEGRLGGDSS
jgi:hypothetical protein